MIILDIGSYDGNRFYDRCLSDKDTIVHAFDPGPDQYLSILEIADIPNLFAEKLAVTDTDGDVTLYINSITGDDCIQQYDQNHINKWVKLIKEHNLTKLMVFKTIRTVPVRSTRLDTFLDNKNIKKVDYLNINTQSECLRVLQSAGTRITDIMAGQLIAAVKYPLYQHQPLLPEILEYLKSNKFEIVNVEPQFLGMERKIVFKKPGTRLTL